MTQVSLLGKGDLAIKIGEWFVRAPGYELAAVVPVVPEPDWTGSLLEWASDQDISVVESGDYRQLDQLPDLRLELAFSVFYDRILDRDFLERCDRILNIHNAPLPRYRGISPINWALKNGEREHGVTIHEIAAGIDDGPIVSQVKFPINPEIDEVRDVYERALRFGYRLFEETMPKLDDIRATPQCLGSASYFSRAEAERLGDRRGWTRSAP